MVHDQPIVVGHDITVMINQLIGRQPATDWQIVANLNELVSVGPELIAILHRPVHRNGYGA